MRAVARSLDEICQRHAAVSRADHNSLPWTVAPYDAVAVTGSVVSGLSDALSRVRAGFELVEVYVRRTDVPDAAYEPLAAHHFEHDGEWVVVARRRHPTSTPRVVGVMLAKDEADVIPDVVASLAKSLDALYYRPGDEATAAAIVASAPRPGWARRIDVPDSIPHADGVRQYLLEAARRDAVDECDPRPMWVMVTQGDEVYHDDLMHHIMLAQVERATVMTCQVATFVLHESQGEGWDWSQPIAQRLTHYVWDFGEHAGFLDHPWVHYNPQEHMRAHPHGTFPAKYASARPVRKHYPFRSPEQARARIEDRLRKSAEHPHGWQPHYENYRAILVGEEVAGRAVKKFHGWFGEAERVEGIW
jgi:hypothetical protein